MTTVNFSMVIEIFVAMKGEIIKVTFLRKVNGFCCLINYPGYMYILILFFQKGLFGPKTGDLLPTLILV